MGSSSNVITGNSITGNNVGLAVRHSDSYPNSPNTFNGNAISGNTGNNIYSTLTAPDGVFNAANNYWGTGVYSEIASKVSDSVAFNPWYNTAGKTTKTYQVGAGETYTTIQAAIDAASAGDTINVAAGNYSESLTITKAVNLIGADKSTTFIKGVSGTTKVVLVDAVTAAMTISGFTIDATSCTTPSRGIQISSTVSASPYLSSHVTIEGNNVVHFTERGIALTYSCDNIVRNNNIDCADVGTANTAGIFATAASNTIDKNTITGFKWWGIYVNGGATTIAQNNVIKGNTLTEDTTSSSRAGIEVYNSGGNTIGGATSADGNTILLSSGSAAQGVQISRYPEASTTSNTIQNNKFDGGWAAFYVAAGVLESTTFSDNAIGATTPPSRYGVNLDGGSAVISGNTFHNVPTSILFGRSSGTAAMGVSITDNTFNGGASGLYPAAIWAHAYIGTTTVHQNIFNLASELTALRSQVTGTNIDAANNYWGTGVYSEIASKISDSVAFNPWYNTVEKTTKTYQVGAGEPYTTIQAAIDAASAGDTINVAAGTYAEQVTVDKSLNILGADKSTTIIDGGNSGIVVVSITADDVTFSGFTVKNSGSGSGNEAGIGLQEVSGCTVENNIVTNNFVGIGLVGSTSNTIESNTLTSNYFGVYVGSDAAPSTGNTIVGNDVSASIYVVLGSTFTGDGIYADKDCNGNTFSNNIVHGNQKDGIYLWKSSTNTIIGNTVTANAASGIELMGSSNNEISENTVSGNLDGFSVRLSGSYPTSHNTITENTITDNVNLGLSAEAGTALIDATNNWWGSVDQSVIQSKLSGDVTFRPYYTDAGMTTLSDVTAPVIEAHADVTAEATSSLGAVVDYTAPIARDVVDGDLVASCAPASGSAFAFGTNTVTCSKTDAAGNVATPTTFSVIVQDTVKPVITLTGSTPVTVQVGSSYSDAGASASDNYDSSVPVDTSGSVNTAVVGSYTLTYSATDSHGNVAVQVTRMVNVVDTIDPEIDIVGSSPVTVQVGDVYVDAGATALDNYDGDITDEIDTVNPVNVHLVGTYLVRYTVEDSSDNEADEVTRTVNVVDTTLPVITLSGSTPVAVEVGSTYVDAGAIADDNYDGDLTSSIVTVNSVNNAVVGTYAVTYDVTDANGNHASRVTRTVNVVDSFKPTASLSAVSPSIAKAGTVTVNVSVADNGTGVYYSTSPTVTIVSQNGTTLTGTQSSYASGVWSGTFSVDSTTGDGSATIRVAGVADAYGNVLVPLDVGNLTIDTVAPSIGNMAPVEAAN